MKYRHSFHAGNFADVHKHVTLLAVLGALQRKDKGLLYLETHAGRGLYEPAGHNAAHGEEAREGIERLNGVSFECPELQHYQREIEAVRAEHARSYPGSPLLAARGLRVQDRGVCFELVPPEARALERALAGYPRVRVQCGDGLAGLSALLPPPERRALVLIDPAYETPRADFEATRRAIDTALGRLSNCVVMVWYPVKDERLTGSWLAELGKTLALPALSAELWIHRRDSAVRLNGSGILLVNPPFGSDARIGLWQPELLAALDGAAHGGSDCRWIVHDQP